ncbi:hypothetical protein EZ313_01780 [Ramlibacter henchirensis]|uniref:DUF998 domain-containing protein n=1 Tax=Ramlibacter henchirensis TaxID=204072 RepID=A0A4Z0C1L9_9BURK|nr:hypothetical protein [Ramlibacter henchirensis]TFZ05426.1 hypothetical protein EZ313_01780 [Ramlibacter henchirensis]
MGSSTALQRVEALNTPPAPDTRELWQHLSGTYFSLRLALAVTAFLLPILLYGWGRFYHGLDLQPSMSAYFWAAGKAHCASFPTRTLFIGGLVAIALALYAYKGLTPLENLLLNAAAAFGAVVASVPERLPVPVKAEDLSAHYRRLYDTCPAIREWAYTQQWPIPVHYIAAVLLFACLFFVALKCACKSLQYLPPDSPIGAVTFRRLYQGIAWAMPAVGGLFFVLIKFAGEEPHTYAFWLEATEIWLFSAYWWLKTYELRLSQVEKDPEAAVLQHHGAEP